jgi:hypothetical protein
MNFIISILAMLIVLFTWENLRLDSKGFMAKLNASLSRILKTSKNVKEYRNTLPILIATVCILSNVVSQNSLLTLSNLGFMHFLSQFIGSIIKANIQTNAQKIEYKSVIYYSISK